MYTQSKKDQGIMAETVRERERGEREGEKERDKEREREREREREKYLNSLNESRQ